MFVRIPSSDFYIDFFYIEIPRRLNFETFDAPVAIFYVDVKGKYEIGLRTGSPLGMSDLTTASRISS